mgnify:CR=1 FL=1
MKLSHLDEAGRARMVDVSGKPVAERTAVAEGAVRMSPEAFELVHRQAVELASRQGAPEVAAQIELRLRDYSAGEK